MSETNIVLPLTSPVESGRDSVAFHALCRPSHAKALQLALASVTAEGGIPLIYGPVGSGKAHVANEIERAIGKARTPRGFAVYRIDAASLARTIGALLGAIAAHLDVRLPREVWARLNSIEKRALEFAARRVVPVIFVANAECLNADGLDDVKFVWDMVSPSGSSFLLRVVLFAEPRLVSRLKKDRFRALRSRISPWCRLDFPV